MKMQFTDQQKEFIWNILKECAGAKDGMYNSMRDGFFHHFPDCIEFRFQGGLGFGGKIWANNRRIYVSCYREEENNERRAMIEATNKRLAEFVYWATKPTSLDVII